jgi:hypothetical protein
MDDNKSRPRDRKVFYIAPLITACVLAGLVAVIVWRQPEPARVATPAPVAAPSPPAQKQPAPAVATLGRSDLILYAQRRADQFAAGSPAAPGADPLTGHRFFLKLPFGCNGANGAMLNPQTAVSYDATQDSLTVTAQPGSWASLPVMQPLVDAGKAEAVEGFWLPRPWTLSESCPPPNSAAPPAIATPATAQTVGLAQIFTPGSARTLRHSEHPYSFTRKLGADGGNLLNHSYYLVLEGTVSGYPDGQSLHCWSEAPDHQPICIYAVTLSRVSFQDSTSGEILASWTD